MGLASLTHLMYRLKRIPCPGPVLGFKEGWKQKAADRLFSVLLQQQRRTKQGNFKFTRELCSTQGFPFGNQKQVPLSEESYSQEAPKKNNRAQGGQRENSIWVDF